MSCRVTSKEVNVGGLTPLCITKGMHVSVLSFFAVNGWNVLDDNLPFQINRQVAARLAAYLHPNKLQRS